MALCLLLLRRLLPVLLGFLCFIANPICPSSFSAYSSPSPSPSPLPHFLLPQPLPGVASFQGRRLHQEDRLVCAPLIPLPSTYGNQSRLRNGGLFGVFDGHLGDHASDLAANSITERFLHHAFRLFRNAGSKEQLSSSADVLGYESYGGAIPSNSPLGGPLLEAALRQAIADIDEEASKSGLISGSTACISLHVDGHIIVANVGDSKALICSSFAAEGNSGEYLVGTSHKQHLMRSKKKRHQMSRRNWEATVPGGLLVQELSEDHRPDRFDEKTRIEASGGFVTMGSVSRVNGQLAVSRSIGDTMFKRYGVTSDPEISGWRNISENDRFLVLASDGIFERMSPQDVCNVLNAVETGKDITAVMDVLEDDISFMPLPVPGLGLPEPNQNMYNLGDDVPSENPAAHIATIEKCFENKFQTEKWNADIVAAAFLRGTTSMAQIMAQILVEVAYRAGSMDNLSAIVIPLKHFLSEYP